MNAGYSFIYDADATTEANWDILSINEKFS